MNDRTDFRLLGIEPDNLLGFLAMLGVLQSLEVEQPTWSSRLAWAGTPWRPDLSVRAEVSDEVLLATIDRGLRKLSTVHDYGGYKDLKFSETIAKDMQLDAATCGNSMREQAISALFSDGAIKPEKDEIVAPPLCTMLGQGHQHFLARLESVSAGILPKALQKKRGAPNLNSVEYLDRALFAPWTRNDETDAFRWDPAEDRRYALRDVDPSSEPSTDRTRRQSIGDRWPDGARFDADGQTWQCFDYDTRFLARRGSPDADNVANVDAQAGPANDLGPSRTPRASRRIS